MHASDGRKWLEGAFPDPEARRYCSIFDAIAAISALVGPELFGLGAAGAAEAGGGAALGAGAAGAAEAAASTILPDVLVSAAAPAAFGGTEALTLGGAAGAAGAGAASADVAGGLSGGAEFAGGASDLMSTGFGGGSMPGTPITTGAGGSLPGPLNIEPLANNAIPAAASAAAPGAAAGIAPVPGGVTGDAAAFGTFPNTFDAGPGTDLLSFNPATGATTAGSAADLGGGGTAAAGSGSIIPQGVKDAFQIGGPLVAGAGLVNNLMHGNQPVPGERQVHQAANSLTATAGAQANKGLGLESFINSGTLPPGLADGLHTATAAAEASIKSTHARSGTTGSSAEAQDIQAAHERAQNAAAQMALQLLQQGSSMVGQAVNTESLAANLYSQIMQQALSQDEALGKAIGNFAGALAGSGGSGGGNTLRITTG